MKIGTLTRDDKSEEGTFGELVVGDLKLQTGELPWHDNLPNISCVPAGQYIAKPFTSPTHGACLMLQNVPGRTDCEVHAGNWCGDRRAGKRSDVLGCIIVGLTRGPLAGQKAVLSSGAALEKLLEFLAGDNLLLTITEAP